MDLSVQEAATLLGVSTRAVRARLVRGELKGRKVEGKWRVDRGSLPLTEAQRRSLQARVESLKEAMDAALPGRLARTPADRRISIADLGAFRAGLALLSALRSEAGAVLPSVLREALGAGVEAALLEVADGFHQFDPVARKAAFDRARSAAARCAARLVIQAPDPTSEPVSSWVVHIENQLVPAIGGLARRADRAMRSPR